MMSELRLISQSISLKLYIPYSNHGARNVAVGAGPSGSDRLSAFHGLPVLPHFGNPTCIPILVTTFYFSLKLYV
jgi:hypothetical protein